MIYIYGPPGVGKFTTGKILSKLTGYKLFHNQLSIEFVRSVFDFGTPPFNKLVLKYRAEIIEEAAKSGRSLIFTSAYAKGFNDDIIKDIIRRVERHKGKVYFVQLFCKENELFRRISSPSRKGFYKIRSKGALRRLLRKYNHLSPIPFRKSLSLDNTNITPVQTAKIIISHYRIRK